MAENYSTLQTFEKAVADAMRDFTVLLSELRGFTDGNSPAGLIRTYDDRITQMEKTLATNTSQLIRVVDMVQALDKDLRERMNIIDALVKLDQLKLTPR